MNIAAIVTDTVLSQNTFYLFKTFNQLSEQGYSPFCFYSSLSNLPISPSFAVLNIHNAHFFSRGPIIATNIENAKLMLKLPIKAKKYLYLWDLEWLRGSYNYIQNVDILRNSNIQLIARSESHAQNIQNYCTRTVEHIISNWEIEGIKKL